jgi:hypothetical protein
MNAEDSTPQNNQDQTKTPEPEVKDWKDIITDDEIKNHASIQNFKDIPSLVKSYIHAQKQIGADKIVLPKNDNDTEAWVELYNKLGRPESIDGYELAEPKDLPESVSFNKELMSEFKTKAHEHGLTKKQAENLYNWYNEKMVGEAQNAVKQIDEATNEKIAALKNEWGKDFETKVETAKAVVKQFGSEQFVSYLEKTNLGNDPEMIKFMNNLAEVIAEDVLIKGDSTIAKTKEGAIQEITRLRADKEFLAKLQNKMDPGYALANETLKNLYEKAYN